MPVAGTQVFKYTRLLRLFLKPLQVDTLFLGYSNLFATNMCIKTFVVHLNCKQYFCNLCVLVVHIRVCVHTYVCTVETRNQHWPLLPPLSTGIPASYHSVTYPEWGQWTPICWAVYKNKIAAYQYCVCVRWQQGQSMDLKTAVKMARWSQKLKVKSS